MSLRLRLFLVAVALVALGVLAATAPGLATPWWPHYLVWVLLCVLGETMTTESPGRRGTWSLSSTVALASVVLWGTGPAVWIAAASTLLSEKVVLRKPWIRAQFNAAQMAITMAAAGGVFALLEPAGAAPGALPPQEGWGQALRLAPAMAGLMLTYHLVNRALVGVPVAWSSERPYLRALREDWFYTERLLNDAAAYLLSPLMVIAYHAISYFGVALFYAPLYMIYLSDRRQLELRQAYEDLKAAQERLVESQLAAEIGELARNLGHDLNNLMAPISARAQMLLRDSEHGVWEHVAKHARLILDQTEVAGEMSRRLRDARLKEPVLAAVRIEDVVRQAVDATRNQPRLEGVEWSVELPELPVVMADAVEMQRVFGNLFVNAADAMKAAPDLAERRITVTAEAGAARGPVRVIVRDSGPGIPADVLPHIFRPRFSTKEKGHGFGLSGSREMVRRHGGDVIAESPPGEGARFIVELPRAAPDATA